MIHAYEVERVQALRFIRKVCNYKWLSLMFRFLTLSFICYISSSNYPKCLQLRRCERNDLHQDDIFSLLGDSC